jgi:LPS-assembly lipoprotein
MWLHNARIGLALAATLTIAACSGLTPLYQDGSATGAYRNLISFADPETRAEQVLIRELKTALGANGAGAPLFSVSINSKTELVSVIATANPAKSKTLTLTAKYTLADPATPDKPILSETRTASATYTTGPQALANTRAESDATERAARRLADIIRARLLLYLTGVAR